MSDDTTRPRPPHGYAIARYDELMRTVRSLPAEIADAQASAERHLASAAHLLEQLAEAEATLAWMREHQADEIAAREAHHWRVLTAIRAARWAREGTL